MWAFVGQNAPKGVTMRANLRSRGVLFVVCGLALCSLAGLGAREKSSEAKLVDCRDIPDRVTVVGKLGLPLNELCTVRGHWFNPHAKDGRPSFRVEWLDGVRLKEAADFRTVEAASIDATEISARVVGTRIRGIAAGVETGGFTGFPPAVYEEWEKLTGGPSFSPSGEGTLFTTKFCVVKILSN